MKTLLHLIVVTLGIFPISQAANPAEAVNKASDITSEVIRSDPRSGSKWIWGNNHKIYDNVLFWSNLKTQHVVAISASDTIPGRMILATVIYSSSDKVSIPSLNSKNIIFGKTKDGWRLIPNEFLINFFQEDEESALLKIESRFEDMSDLRYAQFMTDVNKATNSQQESEKSTEDDLMNQFQEHNLPIDKVLPIPPGSTIPLPPPNLTPTGH